MPRHPPDQKRLSTLLIIERKLLKLHGIKAVSQAGHSARGIHGIDGCDPFDHRGEWYRRNSAESRPHGETAAHVARRSLGPSRTVFPFFSPSVIAARVLVDDPPPRGAERGREEI